VNVLIAFDLPEARTEMIALHPELRRISQVGAAIAHAHNGGLLDEPSIDLTCDVVKSFRNYVGYLQESDRDNLTVGQWLALMRLKQSLRDLVQACCWPSDPVVASHRLVLSQRAVLALGRLRLYDPIQGVNSYIGVMATDIVDLADGVAMQEVAS